MKRIESVTIKKLYDESPDTSCIGEFTDTLEEGVIIRATGEYYNPSREDQEIPDRGREYRFFKPYAGSEKPGTKDYEKYGLQDYKRMEALNQWDFCFLGIEAYAEVAVSTDGKCWKIDKITSSGLWGIESDSENSYLLEEAKNQLRELRDILKEYGFKPQAITAAFRGVLDTFSNSNIV